MANKVPLVVDTSTLYIKELPVGDNLDLTGSGVIGIVGLAGTSANFTGVVTASSFVGALTGNATGLSGTPNITVGTISATSLNASGVVTATTFSGALTGNVTGNVTGNINSSGVSTLGNTVVGGGTTQLVVNGNARITGILTIGTSSITLDGSNNQVNVGTGVTIHHTNGVQVGGNTLHSTILTVNQINSSGVTTAALLNVGVGGTIITTTNTTRVGINSTSPAYTLDVGGNLNFSGSLFQNGSAFSSGVGIQSGGVIIGTGVTTLNFVGAGNTFVVSGTTATISIAGGGVKENTTVSSTSATTIASFAAASFRSAKARIQITQGSSYQVAEVLLIHDGTTVSLVEMASIATGSNLGSFSGTISSGNVLLRVTMSSATSATIRVVIDRTEV